MGRFGLDYDHKHYTFITRLAGLAHQPCDPSPALSHKYHGL